MTSKKTAVKSSSIHGKGVFAGEAIRRRDFIDRFRGQPTKRDGHYVLWVLDEEGNEVGIRGTNGLRFLNHSSKPNAEFVGDELVALRSIRRDEEISIDYGEAWKDVE